MNRTIAVIVIVVFVALVGGYYFFMQQPAPETGAATAPTAATTAEVSEATQAAIDFCKEKGGTVETVVAAEGTTYLCATADGGKAEVGQFMRAADQ